MQDSRPTTRTRPQTESSTPGALASAASSLHEIMEQKLATEALDKLHSDWDQVGGGPCASLRASAEAALQASPVGWHQLLFAADALQELCWEKLHTGHWMDVHVAWRDAYTLYTVLAVTAKLAVAAGGRSVPTAAVTVARGCGAAAEAPTGTVGPQQQEHQHRSQAVLSSRTSAHAAAATASTQQRRELELQLLRDALHQLDLAAMMGGLRFRTVLNSCITTTDQVLQQCMQTNSIAAGEDSGPADMSPCATDAGGNTAINDVSGTGGTYASAADLHPTNAPKRQRAAGWVAIAAGAGAGAGAAPNPPSLQDQQQEVHLPPGSLTAASAVVPVELCPSIEQFLMKYMMAEGGPRPVVTRGAMQHWPALTRWQDMNYLSRVAGRRTVPVEVGQHYMQEDWGTSLMTLDDFIHQHITSAAGVSSTSASHLPRTDHQQQQHERLQQLGYLAQHQLFEQIPALAADIATPEYCMLGEQGVSSINAWFGPGGTVTPLHQDPEHNFLAQVVGRKYVRLYDPCYTSKLYPHDQGMHTNTSKVDVESVDDAVFPGFKNVPYMDLVLEPGHMLYIPPRWWHFVKSVSISFSVSFWWI